MRWDGVKCSSVKTVWLFQDPRSCHLLEKNGAISLQLVGDLELGREPVKLTPAALCHLEHGNHPPPGAARGWEWMASGDSKVEATCAAGH